MITTGYYRLRADPTSIVTVNRVLKTKVEIRHAGQMRSQDMKIADFEALYEPKPRERVLQLVKEFEADGSYKGAIELAGRMHAIAIACKYDDYWQEKAETGYRRELFDLRKATASHPGDRP